MNLKELGTNHYNEAMQRILDQLVPPDFEATFPLISWTPLKEPPAELSFFFCTKFNRNAFRFFHEMVTRSLIPGKKLQTSLQFALNFSLRDELYTGGEVRIQIENKMELALIEKNLSGLETELKKGFESEYSASRLLENKGILPNGKLAFVQERIDALVKRRPQDFDSDIFPEMHHFFAICNDDFKARNSPSYLSRIFCIHYLFRKTLLHTYEAFPERRCLFVKLLRNKKKMGITIGFSFLKENEIFEEKHIIKAISSLIPKIKSLEDSFLVHGHSKEAPKTFYLEIEKQDASPFSMEEMDLLKEELPTLLKNRIEERHFPLFMPENEEEIMRHILSLSSQIKFVRDLPQVVIQFHKQTADKLEFLVIVVRAKNINSRTLTDLFALKPTFLDYTFNRTKMMGLIGKKTEKEASVFRLGIAKDLFLRENHSIDLYKARQKIAFELAKVIGDFRDYNGGIISKESELFTELREELKHVAIEHSFLLENFFYSLMPAVMRSVLPKEPLKKLFFLLLEGEKEGLSPSQHYLYRIEEDETYFYFQLMMRETALRKRLEKVIEELKIPNLQLAKTFVQTKEYPCFGVIYRKTDPVKTRALKHGVEKVMTESFLYTTE